MLFDRRRKHKSPEPADSRSEYRYALPPDHPLRVQLLRADGDAIEVLPVDLTARGAGFRTFPDVSFNENEVFEVVITSESDGWTVRTPGMVRHGEHDGDAVDWGVEFINLGNLYGQWDNVLGRYFNRRRQRRASPELDHRISAELSRNGRQLIGSLHDLTAHGAGVVVRHREAPDVQCDEIVELSFRLPRSRCLTGAAIVRQVRCAGAQDLVGMEFDLSDPAGFARHQRQISGYCARRNRAVSEWESAWRGAA